MDFSIVAKWVYYLFYFYANLKIFAIKSKSNKTWSSYSNYTLLTQALPSLIISVIGLVFAGDLMDEFQVSEIIKNAQSFTNHFDYFSIGMSF